MKRGNVNIQLNNLIKLKIVEVNMNKKGYQQIKE